MREANSLWTASGAPRPGGRARRGAPARGPTARHCTPPSARSPPAPGSPGLGRLGPRPRGNRPRARACAPLPPVCLAAALCVWRPRSRSPPRLQARRLLPARGAQRAEPWAGPGEAEPEPGAGPNLEAEPEGRGGAERRGQRQRDPPRWGKARGGAPSRGPGGVARAEWVGSVGGLAVGGAPSGVRRVGIPRDEGAPCCPGNILGNFRASRDESRG